MRTFLIILSVSFILNNTYSQSYEGTMSRKTAGKDVNLLIWVDLEIPQDNGIVKGTYFYKTIGRDIHLSGKKEGEQLSLAEKDKNQKTTGIFSLKVSEGELTGFWLKPNGKDTFQVELFKTNPSFRKTARLPKLEVLLTEDIAFYSNGMDSTDIYQGVNYSVLFAGSNLLSVELNWENWSYTARYGTIHYTYNLANDNEVVNLKNEVTDSCYAYLCRKIQEIVTNNREEYRDSDWVVGLYSGYINNDQDYKEYLEKIQDLFTVTSLPERAELYLDKEGLICYLEDYCEQNFSAGNRGMTFDCTVTIPFSKLRQFIDEKSVLQNLFYR